MEINLENIKNPNFRTHKKGYDKEQVNEYCSSVYEEILSLTEKIQTLHLEKTELENKISDFEDVEKELKDEIISLRMSKVNEESEAEVEAEKIIQNAKKKSKTIIDEAELEAKSTRDTLLFLKEQKEILIARLKIIIANQEGMLKDLAKGDNEEKLQRTMAEAAALKAKAEMNVESILEKLL